MEGKIKNKENCEDHRKGTKFKGEIEKAAKNFLKKTEDSSLSVGSDIKYKEGLLKECAECGLKFDKEDDKENTKFAKCHYSTHYKGQIEEEFKDTFRLESVPLACPFNDCEFS